VPSGWRSTFIGYAFLAPALVLLGVFTFYPMGYGIYLSFTKYNIINPPEWIGLQNFYTLQENPVFWKSLLNSVKYLLIVPCIQLACLFLAVQVNRKLPAMSFFRSTFYVPVVTTISVVGVMWNWMYAEAGSVNWLLLALGIIDNPVSWLNDPDTALYAVMFVTFWSGLGYYMVLYIAGLQAIPSEIDEAARLDGANGWQRFWRITVPLLKPTILLCVLLSTIAAVRVLNEIVVLTRGGPANSTYTALYYMYDKAFRSFKMGEASAASLIVMAVCILLSLVQFRLLSEKRRKVSKKGGRAGAMK
jgi:putative chitobiose transport system permease protein